MVLPSFGEQSKDPAELATTSSLISIRQAHFVVLLEQIIVDAFVSTGTAMEV
jgi:hypothetical protein